ncbi:MAG: HAD family hydrolase [Pseudomonadota bacterium]
MSAGPDLNAMPEPEIAPALLEQLEAVPLRPGHPLLVVDADEVLVVFAAHLARYADGQGLEMRLERYSLEGAFRDRASGALLPFDGAIALINRFVTTETVRQEPVPGGAPALGRLEEVAQIVVLTNVPRHGREARVENLTGLGMPYPVVENGGGKGPALAWLAAKVSAPTVFVDDSPRQIESAKDAAPDVVCVHFAGAPMVAEIIPDCPAADHRVGGWKDAEALIRGLLG